MPVSYSLPNVLALIRISADGVNSYQTVAPLPKQSGTGSSGAVVASVVFSVSAKGSVVMVSALSKSSLVGMAWRTTFAWSTLAPALFDGSVGRSFEHAVIDTVITPARITATVWRLATLLR